MGVAVIGIVAICIDIAILIAIGSNPGYSAEARWACVALVPLLWLFGGHLIELEVKWQHHCRARRRARSAVARVKNGR